MIETAGFILTVNFEGNLVTPAIKKENGEIVMQGRTWDEAIKYLDILEKVNAIYVRLLDKQRIKTN